MTRHVPRRPGDPPRSDFRPLPFHGWWGCQGCGGVVFDWALHECHGHEDEDQADELAPIGPDDLVARARAEGGAVVTEFSAWREAWRQVAACLRLRPPKDPRPAAPTIPRAAAGRAEQWAAMDGLIKRTTEA